MGFLDLLKKVPFELLINDDGDPTARRVRREKAVKRSLGIPDSNLDDGNPIRGIFNSFIAHVFKDHVDPVPGSIVLCSLAGELADHSGIYVGNGNVVELHGEGYIHKVSAEKFLRGPNDGSFPLRTGMSIYVACSGTKPIASNVIKNRAEEKCDHRVDYSLFSNNCHDFSSYCISGEVPKGICTYTTLLSVIGKFAGTKHIDWRVWDH